MSTSDSKGRPHVEQYGVRDDLATAEQQSARTRGRYDPRPGSGAPVALRVRLICANCRKLLSEVHDFERRALVYSAHDSWWFRMTGRIGADTTYTFKGSKCRDCYAPLEPAPRLDVDKILRSIDRAREAGSVVTVRVGKVRHAH